MHKILSIFSFCFVLFDPDPLNFDIVKFVLLEQSQKLAHSREWFLLEKYSGLERPRGEFASSKKLPRDQSQNLLSLWFSFHHRFTNILVEVRMERPQITKTSSTRNWRYKYFPVVYLNLKPIRDSLGSTVHIVEMDFEDGTDLVVCKIELCNNSMCHYEIVFSFAPKIAPIQTAVFFFIIICLKVEILTTHVIRFYIYP